jgi:hypothetical protein
MPENKEMLGKILDKNPEIGSGLGKETIVTLPGYDPKKAYKLHILKVKQLGPKIKITPTVSGKAEVIQ